MDNLEIIKEEIEIKTFAHITLGDNKVVNIFDWKEEKNPDLGKQNLLVDITGREDKAEIKIGDIYDRDREKFVTPEIEEIKEKTVQDVKNEVVFLLQEILEKIKLL